MSAAAALLLVHSVASLAGDFHSNNVFSAAAASRCVCKSSRIVVSPPAIICLLVAMESGSIDRSWSQTTCPLFCGERVLGSLSLCMCTYDMNLKRDRSKEKIASRWIVWWRGGEETGVVNDITKMYNHWARAVEGGEREGVQWWWAVDGGDWCRRATRERWSTEQVNREINK